MNSLEVEMQWNADYKAEAENVHYLGWKGEWNMNSKFDKKGNA
jgi:hypothetical protein